VLIPGNAVRADYRARTDDQLPALTVELLESRAILLSEALPTAGMEWSTALTATILPEGQPYPRLYGALDGLLGAITMAPSARGWGAALVRYELLLLAELGFGLDLSGCVAGGGPDDLAFVSPKSGAAVSRDAGEPYRDRLLPLPAFLIYGGEADWPGILDGLRLTGHFLERDLLHGRTADLRSTRDRLVERLKRLGG
jgi:DNA repair protein RecO (recombination protein O)